MISFYRDDSPYAIYSHGAWWGDNWDAQDHGRDFDFNRPFFEQFHDLQKAVPRIGMVVNTCENCDFGPYCVRCKDCYMCISCLESESLYYYYQTNKSRDCIDCSLCTKCEVCYECLYCVGLFSSGFCKDCENGSELWFCQDCKGCNNCIGCKNLSSKEYHVFNQSVSKEEFAKMKASLMLYGQREALSAKVQEFHHSQPTRAAHLINCEASSGDHLQQCRNASSCFDSLDLEDCGHAYTCPGRMKDCNDIDYSPGAQVSYDCLSVVDSYGARFCLHSWEGKDLTYCDECFSCEHCFGCIGLKKKQYCILNKQYTPEEYESLVSRIIEHMKKAPYVNTESGPGPGPDPTTEWGEYFPISISPFPYNETIAQSHYPLSQEEASGRGYAWDDRPDPGPDVSKVLPGKQLPDDISAIPDEILQWAIQCEQTSKPFRIIEQELTFYREQKHPAPHFHPETRYEHRMARTNKRSLITRPCGACGKNVETTVVNEAEKILCDDCYLGTVY